MTGHLYHLPTGTPVTLRTPRPDELRTYAATVIAVTDADTIKADIDLGVAGMWLHDRRLRLAGCNARETHGAKKQPGGPEATAAVVDELSRLGGEIRVRVISETADPHGRWLVSVALSDGTDLTEWLVANQWAARWNGHGDPPVPPWPRGGMSTCSP